MTEKIKLYEGKAKILYDNGDGTLIQYFKDSATAFNNQKKEQIAGKGRLNNLISEKLMLALQKEKVPTHFIKRIDERQQIIRKLKILPLEIIVRNITAGTLCKRYGLKEGVKLSTAFIEYCVKDDELGDPPIAENLAILLGMATAPQINQIKTLSLQINEFLQSLFLSCNLILVDFKLEFGIDDNGSLFLADEISPDTCRLWDKKTNEKMDKDRFRQDLGNLIEAYKEVAMRLGIKI